MNFVTFFALLCPTILAAQVLAAQVPNPRAQLSALRTSTRSDNLDLCALDLYTNAGNCVCFLIFSGIIQSAAQDITEAACLSGRTVDEYLQEGPSCDDFSTGGKPDLEQLEDIIDFFVPLCTDLDVPSADYTFVAY